MLTKKETSILMLYRKEILLSKTIREISIMLKKSYPKTFEAVKKLEKKGVLRLKKAGKSSMCEINLSEKAIPSLSAVEFAAKEARTDIPYKNISRITEKIKSPFYSLLIGGSYADGKQKPTSDIDIAIIIPNSENKKVFQNALKEGELMIPEVHGFVFTQEEFYLMLTNNEFNFGKEMVRKHIIFYGAEPYYKILFEAIEHGFKG